MRRGHSANLQSVEKEIRGYPRGSASGEEKREDPR
jgi:hypothetical protein